MFKKIKKGLKKTKNGIKKSRKIPNLINKQVKNSIKYKVTQMATKQIENAIICKIKKNELKDIPLKGIDSSEKKYAYKQLTNLKIIQKLGLNLKPKSI
jgi:hypothetical protein